MEKEEEEEGAGSGPPSPAGPAWADAAPAGPGPGLPRLGVSRAGRRRSAAGRANHDFYLTKKTTEG